MKESVIVVGPQGCGKTKNAEALRQRFHLGNILDDWKPDQPIPEDTLVLTNVERCDVSTQLGRVISYLEIMPETELSDEQREQGKAAYKRLVEEAEA